MQKDNSLYLKHIRDSICKIEGFVEGLDLEGFLSEDRLMTRSAVVRELEVVGEAANRVEKNYQTEHPEIPWRDMIDTRNKVVHDYFMVDYDLAWDIIKKDLPKLRKDLEKIVGVL
jgi:uncharacterized protein with HEPN domain